MRKVIINSKSNLTTIAETITCDSFGDEVMSVVASLRKVLADAENYGCDFTRTINDCWGGRVVVTAVPAVRRHSWTF